MYEQLSALFGDPAATVIYYGLIAIAVLIALWVLRILWRRLSATPFMANASHRKHRLAIIDATPVDNRRRLVLVRRDEVEHLILIGGMNDVLIESNIKHRSEMATNDHEVKPAKTPPPLPTKVPEPAREPQVAAPVKTAPAPVSAARTAPASGAPMAPSSSAPMSPAPRREPIEPRPQETVQRPVQPRPTQSAPMAPPAPAPSAPVTPPSPAPRPVVETPRAPTPAPSFDDDLDMDMGDIDMDFDITPDQLTPQSAPSVEHAQQSAKVGPSRKIDDEMEELLNQLSGDKKP